MRFLDSFFFIFRNPCLSRNSCYSHSTVVLALFRFLFTISCPFFSPLFVYFCWFPDQLDLHRALILFIFCVFSFLSFTSFILLLSRFVPLCPRFSWLSGHSCLIHHSSVAVCLFPRLYSGKRFRFALSWTVYFWMMITAWYVWDHFVCNSHPFIHHHSLH